MSGKWWKRCTAVAIVDVLAFVLTIRAHLHFHRTATGPDVMTAGQVLGWIISGGLFLALILMILSARRDREWAEYRARSQAAEPDSPGSATGRR